MMYKVYYWRPEFSKQFLLRDYSPLRVDNLDKTHVLIAEVPAADKESVYQYMQGEVWSPNGEARDLIERNGLSHTSMSTGDILVDESGFIWIVDWIGFKKLCKKVD